MEKDEPTFIIDDTYRITPESMRRYVAEHPDLAPTVEVKGSSDSGFYGHEGRPGFVGGSLPPMYSAGKQPPDGNYKVWFLSKFTGSIMERDRAAAGLDFMMSKGTDAAKFVYEAYENFKYGEYTCKVTSIGCWGRERHQDITVYGKLYDKDGNQVGDFERTFHAANGTIYNAGFHVNTALQGGGLGTALYANQEYWAAVCGFKRFEVSAGLSGGGYSWARCGYEFKLKSYTRSFRNTFHDALLREGFSTEQAAKAVARLTHPWEFAKFLLPRESLDDSMFFGKSQMRGSGWSGIKRIDPRNRGWIEGLAYYEARRKKLGKKMTNKKEVEQEEPQDIDALEDFEKPENQPELEPRMEPDDMGGDDTDDPEIHKILEAHAARLRKWMAGQNTGKRHQFKNKP